MRRWRTLILSALSAVVVLTLMTGVTPAIAQDAVTVTPSGDAVNVRSGPGTAFTLRGTLYPTFTLTATGRNNDGTTPGCADTWLRVELIEGVEGWLNLCLVDVVAGNATALPVVEPLFPVLIADMAALTVLDSGTWTPADPAMAALTLGPAVLREFPSLGADVLGSIAGDEVIELLAITDTGDWLMVQYGDYIGWIARFMAVVTPEQESALPVMLMDDIMDDMIADYLADQQEENPNLNSCKNEPPPWAMAHGWRERCQGIEPHTYEPALPPGHERKLDDESGE